MTDSPGMPAPTLASRLGHQAQRLAGNVAGVVVSPAIARRVAELPGSSPSAIVLCVYSGRNAGNVEQVVDQARTEGWEVRLWALDFAPPQLAPFTRATGPTPRIAGLTTLVGHDGFEGADWIVVADDDVAVPPRGLATFVGLSARADLSLAQPAQDARGFPSHPFTLRRPLSLVRETAFVEGGPIIAVRTAWWDTLMAPSEEMGMGWGIEILWAAQRKSGARLGIVDGVVMRHLAPPGRRYDQGPEKQRVKRLLDEHGLPSLAALQTTVSTWRPWRRHPPWIASPR